MSTSMGRRLGALVVVLHAFVACDPDSRATHPVGPSSGGTGGTDPTGTGGTDPKGTGGTDPTGTGGTDPKGTGGTDPKGTGGTDPVGTGGTGGTDPEGQGGAAGAAGSAGAAGEQGFAGAAGHGPCENDCEPCENDYVFTECEDNRCVCEHPNNTSKQDHAELLACDLDEPCPPSIQDSDPGSFRWEGSACLLTALRDRTPGKYQFSDTFSDLGSRTNDSTFLLNGSDEILVLGVTTNEPIVGNLVRSYYPALSCTLKSYDELEACVAAGSDWAPITTGGEQPVCRYTSDWFQDCVEVETPECPVE